MNEYNHNLNIKAVAFKKNKRFSNEMMNDIQFLSQHCKLEVTTQRRYLEAKYPSHPIFSQNLYASIKKF